MVIIRGFHSTGSILNLLKKSVKLSMILRISVSPIFALIRGVLTEILPNFTPLTISSIKVINIAFEI